MEETVVVEPSRRADPAAVVVAGGPDGAGAAGGRQIAAALAERRRAAGRSPSYLGRRPGGGGRLTELCELAGRRRDRVGADVDELPADHPLHLGYQWSTTQPESAARGRGRGAGGRAATCPGSRPPAAPALAARIYVVDIDPIKEQMTLWHVPAARYARADSATALAAGGSRGAGARRTGRGARSPRGPSGGGGHRAQRRAVGGRERPGGDGTVTAEYLVACVREAVGPDAIVLTEAITNYPVVCEHLRHSTPGIARSAAAAARWAGPAARRSAPSWPPRSHRGEPGGGRLLPVRACKPRRSGWRAGTAPRR